ncbi:hypothetical protein [Flavobacterium branchiophilum]|uniref:Uncharacterized protein n=1 Tax=Flavobacterium branchiophilum TaxID=55197 RepID=A0A2H3KXG8_9FLAO|nr:hypothetical protein [Flavobacterium branchiophilum]PDS25681.1 hypothetical protein B0A77_04225 [Flavobacterium branchiophilum]
MEIANSENATNLQTAKEPPSVAGGLLYYYHPDHLGTSTALTDFFGNAYQIRDSSNSAEKNTKVR